MTQGEANSTARASTTVVTDRFLYPIAGVRSYQASGKSHAQRGGVMSWIYLVSAGLLEIGWPVGLKMAQTEGQRLTGIVLAVAFMALSGFLLWLAQRDIPMGTSYAVWTGIGAAGTFVFGILFYGDVAALGRIFGVSLIVMGVITLKLAH
jgi:quaternary ammonium compound-resistance protein SugE